MATSISCAAAPRTDPEKFERLLAPAPGTIVRNSLIAARHHVMAVDTLPISFNRAKTWPVLFQFPCDEEKPGYGSNRLATAGDLRKDTRPRRGWICLGVSAAEPRLPACLPPIEPRNNGNWSYSLVATSALGTVFSRPIPCFRPASKPYSGHHRLRRLSSSLFPPLLRPLTRLTLPA